MPFQHQKLLVYQKALDALAEVVRISAAAKPGWPDLIDQLKRAATSIVLNIAEGAAEFRKAEKARFYRMAIQSAAECHAACDIMVRVGSASAAQIGVTQALLEEIAAMLVAMCKEVESRR